MCRLFLLRNSRQQHLEQLLQRLASSAVPPPAQVALIPSTAAVAVVDTAAARATAAAADAAVSTGEVAPVGDGAAVTAVVDGGSERRATANVPALHAASQTPRCVTA